MAKYRKKPVVIEANQWLKVGDHLKVDYYHHPYVPGCDPCKPDIFEATYEAVEQ